MRYSTSNLISAVFFGIVAVALLGSAVVLAWHGQVCMPIALLFSGMLAACGVIFCSEAA